MDAGSVGKGTKVVNGWNSISSAPPLYNTHFIWSDGTLKYILDLDLVSWKVDSRAALAVVSSISLQKANLEETLVMYFVMVIADIRGL